MNNVEIVKLRDLCVSCGACRAVCRSNAIEMTYRGGVFSPSVNEERCTKCSLCLSICPSYKVDVQKTFVETDFTRTEAECYIAHANDEKTRANGTSGGVVSEIVKSLLALRRYEKAYLLKYDKFDGTEAKILPIVSSDKIAPSAKSKYIPASIEQVVKDIMANAINKSIIVATPCQTLAIRRALEKYSKSQTDVLILGLFCDKTLNYNIYDYYTREYGNYTCLNFRDKSANGWPGDTVLVRNGENRVIDRGIRIQLKPYFQLNRCRYCIDKLNMLADISCGDCYIPGINNILGESNIIIRTQTGRDALELCKNTLTISPVEFGEIKESQHLKDKLSNVERNLRNGIFYNFPQSLTFSGENIMRETEDKRQMALGGELYDKKGFYMIKDKLSHLSGTRNQKVNPLNRSVQFIRRILYNPDNSYKVLIDHAGFKNRGAQLMLVSVVDQLKKRMPFARIVVPQSVYNENPSYCIWNDILPLRDSSNKVATARRKFAYNNILNEHMFVTAADIDMILDAGGFQFSDQWKYGEQNVEEWKNYYTKFTKKGLQIFFLPQAFGPFNDTYSRKTIEHVHSIATSLYARERVSFLYLRDTFPDSDKIKLCPDFTILAEAPDNYTVSLPDKEYVVIIVNARMIDHSDTATSTSYMNFMCRAAQTLIDRGEKIVLVNHEGEGDEHLMRRINESLSKTVLMLNNLDAMNVKQVIGKAKLLICSRYHGVVSGLVQGVPTLCTSWSHKYAELLKEHGCMESLLDVAQQDESIEKINDALQNSEKYTSKKGCCEKIIMEVNRMWNEVLSNNKFL